MSAAAHRRQQTHPDGKAFEGAQNGAPGRDLLAAARAVVTAVPAGRVVTYGQIGDIIGVGPRQAGRLVAALDDAPPWWRVVYADGTPAACHGGVAAELLQAEDVPFRGARVEMGAARMWGNCAGE